MTVLQIFGILAARPFPGSVDLRMSNGGCCFTVEGVALGYYLHGWGAYGRVIPAEWPIPGDLMSDTARVHAEIRRVLAMLAEPATSWEEVKGRCVGPDLPGDDTPQDRITDEIDRRKDVEAQLAKMTDAHAVVSQRLIGAQKEVAEVTAERDDATARADKVEDRLRRDESLREQIAIAVGLDGSAILALILDTVTRDRPVRELSRLSGLLDVLAAPVAFGGRRLSTAERAEWALRRWLAEGKECSARMAQLIEAEVMLDCMGVPAYAAVPGDDPGDASEALTVAERLRLHFGARS